FEVTGLTVAVVGLTFGVAGADAVARPEACTQDGGATRSQVYTPPPASSTNTTDSAVSTPLFRLRLAFCCGALAASRRSRAGGSCTRGWPTSWLSSRSLRSISAGSGWVPPALSLLPFVPPTVRHGS